MQLGGEEAGLRLHKVRILLPDSENLGMLTVGNNQGVHQDNGTDIVLKLGKEGVFGVDVGEGSHNEGLKSTDGEKLLEVLSN